MWLGFKGDFILPSSGSTKGNNIRLRDEEDFDIL